MEINLREKEGISIIDIKGKLAGEGNNVEFRNTLDSLLAKNKKKILLNLSDLEYIDSTGVGELVSGLKTVENLGGELKLINLGDRTRNTLSISLLLPVFDISNTETEAIAKFKS